ncbi:MAG: hypothetical protein AAF982_03470 [Pseudomonadota bacterium]
MPTPTIVLHLGAHKTATSHLQKSLQRNGTALERMGVSFLPPAHYRQTFASLQIELRDGADIENLRRTAKHLVRGAANGKRRLILSDENIMGNMPRLMKENDIYPWARGRVGRTVRILSYYRPEICLAVRNLAGFIPSAYGEALRHAPYRSFERFVSNADLHALSWARLIGKLASAARETKFFVWRYEDYDAHKTDILQALLNAACPDDFDFVGKRTRPGLSARALEALADWSAKGHDIRGERLIGKAEELYPTGEEWPPFDPFTPNQRAIFDANYQRDWDEIKAMPDVAAFHAQTAMN